MINLSWNYSYPELGIAKVPILTAQNNNAKLVVVITLARLGGINLRQWRCNLDLDGKTGHSSARIQYIIMTTIP